MAAAAAAMLDEPVLRPNPHRFTLMPIAYPDLWQRVEEAQQSFWVASIFDFAEDQKDWATKLTPDERKFLTLNLAFFAGADGIVMENLHSNFAQEVQVPEARHYYAFQECIEAVHAETYARMIDVLVTDPAEKLWAFHAITEVDSIRRMSAWAQRYLNPATHRFAERLLAFAIFEGVGFSGSFASIFFFKQKGLMPTLVESNLYIARDESSHQNFAVLLHSHLRHRVDHAVFLAMLTEFVALVEEFVCDALNVALIGINRDLMAQYIRSTADRLLVSLGWPKHYQVNNPFGWLDTIGIGNKANFFERREHAYRTKVQSLPHTDFAAADTDF